MRYSILINGEECNGLKPYKSYGIVYGDTPQEAYTEARKKYPKAKNLTISDDW